MSLLPRFFQGDDLVEDGQVFHIIQDQEPASSRREPVLEREEDLLLIEWLHLGESQFFHDLDQI